MVTSKLFKVFGLTAISNCFNLPPQVATSATPSIPCNCGMIIQSWIVLNLIASYLSSYPFLAYTSY